MENIYSVNFHCETCKAELIITIETTSGGITVSQNETTYRCVNPTVDAAWYCPSCAPDDWEAQD